MRTGRCLCGEVRYAVDGPVRDILVCHCVECVRWAGVPWAAAAARRDEITIAGGELLRWLPSPGSAEQARRGSCSECGSALFWAAPGRDTVSFAAGSLDDPEGLVVAGEIWLEQAPAWDVARTGAPTYAGPLPDDAPAIRWSDWAL